MFSFQATSFNLKLEKVLLWKLHYENYILNYILNSKSMQIGIKFSYEASQMSSFIRMPQVLLFWYIFQDIFIK